MAIRTTQVTADVEGVGAPQAVTTQVTADVLGVGPSAGSGAPVARVTQMTVDVLVHIAGVDYLSGVTALAVNTGSAYVMSVVYTNGDQGDASADPLKYIELDLGPIVPPVIAALPIRSGIGGNPPCAVRYRSWNAYDQCLLEDYKFARRLLNFGGPARLCRNSPYSPDAPPWIEMPRQGRRFHAVASIALPVDDGLDYTVLSLRVPSGYDGIVIGVTNYFTGTGYVESSGDITWRIRADSHYVRNMGAISGTLGKPRKPSALKGAGYMMQSGQTWQYRVSITAGASLRLSPGNIICGLNGWFWPRA